MPRLQAARPAALPHDRRRFRTVADQALSRAAGAPLIDGNRVRLLRDAAENYPAWSRAIIDARHAIHIEMYIVHRDAVGRRFVELLATRARAGVKVRLLYDWWGCGAGPLLGLFRPLREAGGEVRAFNPPTVRSVLGWTRRNHRKVITVDGRVSYISGLCIGQMWEGDPARKLGPWRDTGIEVTGPAVAQIEEAFVDTWTMAGGEIAPASLPGPDDLPATGDVALRIVPTQPFTGNLLQLDLMIAAMARRQLWITDAYFVGHGPYVEALRRAAADGVDVRLLLPRNSDLGWTVPLSRSLYHTLLDAGVRVFEWNGSMLHAKTAVADGRWARVGSTNLNLVSWLGNWELDVAIDDPDFAGRLAAQFQRDLEQSTEIVAGRAHRPPAAPVRVRARSSARRASRVVRGVGSSIGAAVTGSRPLEDFEISPLLASGVALTALAALAAWRPAAIAWPLAFLLGWTGLSLLGEGLGTWWHRRRRSRTS